MNDAARLPPAEKHQLSLGFLRLSDSAPLIMAQALGYYEKYGLEVHLQREVSWANVRDKLFTGDLDAAQMLAPLPLATSLGVGGMRADMMTGLALSLNGNAITVSLELAKNIADCGGDAAEGARSTASAFGRYLRSGDKPITLAAAHTFSCHILQLRHWLRTGDIDPNQDVHIIVLPPEQMVDSLARGVIDGFCVGEPWNSLAVQLGIGSVQATGYQIWNNSVEKVLGVTESWHHNHPGSHLRLRLALMEACSWLGNSFNREQAASVLSEPGYLDLAPDRLKPSLTGQFVFSKGAEPSDLPHFHVFGRFQAGFPWRSDGEWLLHQMGELIGKPFREEEVKSLVQRTFRTDLYREAARHLSLPCPSQDYKPMDEHSKSWEIEPGIELGPDILLS
ncbi:MAG: ABC-type nitrate/sulfonate/bicarbonate transport system substrate-binding protein [Halieaceae bacterium]|jgi:ABC-type nitrate/sulfonate/bicarbonate transport system substrate-binding protein